MIILSNTVYYLVVCQDNDRVIPNFIGGNLPSPGQW